MTLVWRESLEVEALRTDRYLEGLLSGTERPGPRPEAGLVATAARLRRDLTRVHPSFRFEERLARRLADVAAAMRSSAAAGSEGVSVPVVPFPLSPDFDPADLDVDGESGAGVSRPVLIGGAVASAALSLAGAALVAWRLGRSSGDPVGRVIRVAGDIRTAGRTAGQDRE